MSRRPLLALAAFAVAGTPAMAQGPFPEDSVIQHILDQRVAEKRTFGVVLATLDRAGAVRSFTAGSSGAPGVPLDRETVFEIGSITKTFTAALLAQMVSAGEVALDDPVQKYLPATVKVPERGGRQITLLDLATQSSGLPSLPSNFKPRSMSNPYADFTVEQMYQFLSGYTLERDIGSHYEYSNLGVGLLGHALALRGGKSYEALLTERILRPLGMDDTRITLTPELTRRLAPGHDDKGRQVANWDIPTPAGAGALRSTVGDMLRYLAANLDTAGPLGRVLAMTHESRRPAGGDQMTIGLAWHILHAPGGNIVWHNGGTGGYRSFIGFDPVGHRGVVLLTNSAIGADDIGFHLLDRALPLTKPPAPHHEIAVDSTVLRPYAGVYQLTPALALTVTLDRGNLTIQATGQGVFRLRPESATRFFIQEVDAEVTFVKAAGGAVTGLVFEQGGQSSTAPKVK